MGRLAEAWIAPAEIRELREITRYRGKLVQLRTSCKDQVHGVLVAEYRFLDPAEQQEISRVAFVTEHLVEPAPAPV